MKEHNFEQTGWRLDALLPAREGKEFERALAELERILAYGGSAGPAHITGEVGFAVTRRRVEIGD